MDPHSPCDLQRFVDAQAPVYLQVRRELQDGCKRSHWMWFIFPQLLVLGRSATARHYPLIGAEHAVAYVEHPLLGARLRECSTLVSKVKDRTALQIFGSPDNLKLCSSMTLFAHVAPGQPVFCQVLQQLYGGVRDQVTVAALQS